MKERKQVREAFKVHGAIFISPKPPKTTLRCMASHCLLWFGCIGAGCRLLNTKEVAIASLLNTRDNDGENGSAPLGCRIFGLGGIF